MYLYLYFTFTLFFMSFFRRLVRSWKWNPVWSGLSLGILCYDDHYLGVYLPNSYHPFTPAVQESEVAQDALENCIKHCSSSRCRQDCKQIFNLIQRNVDTNTQSLQIVHGFLNVLMEEKQEQKLMDSSSEGNGKDGVADG